MSSAHKGFTLIEALAAIALLSIGIVGVLGGLSSLARGEARAREQELVQRLAIEKYDELVATAPDLAAPQNGDFEDRNLTGFRWESQSEPTGVENLEAITVTVTREPETNLSPVGRASGLRFVPPVTTGAATP